MSIMKNPITEMREEIGVSRKTFCVMYEVPFSTLCNTENGNTSVVAQSVIAALRRAGISRERLEEVPIQFKKWQREQAEEEWKRRKTLQSA